ncbi:AsnC family transcriptional regulator [Aquicoccus sp.]|uniref:siroheme decarboxylase subunit beta n=1 Tax=Aquicoccus sp. TaxID=2055851 RepID=UPI003568BBD5
MAPKIDPTDARLLQEYQRDLPLVRAPFATIAADLGLEEGDVIARLHRLQGEGKISRVGATVRPNTAGASTLAALAVPDAGLEEVARMVSQEPCVNHSYHRENRWNLWFVATAADRLELSETLARIGRRSGLRVLDLPLVRAFNIDLGFRLNGPRHSLGVADAPDLGALREADRPLLQALSRGLELCPAPFAALGRDLAMGEAQVIARIHALLRAGILTRIGVIVRHRALGWASNAMVAFEVPDNRIEAAGRALTRHPGVTLCYQRRTAMGLWPYGLFCMIHARSRSEALGILDGARALPDLRGTRHQVMFSLRCFKQTGARLTRQEDAA